MDNSQSMRFAALSLSAVLLASCATAPKPAPSLATSIDGILAASKTSHAIWGIVVEDDAGHVLYDHNAHTLLMPASNRKLLSAATDANCLGLETQLPTELWIDGPDVIVRGDGDPSFGSDRHASPGFAPFVAALQARHVAEVRDVIADVSRFDDVTIPGSWKVGNLPSNYSAPVDALAFEENTIGDDAVSDPAVWTALQFRDALVAAGIRVAGTVRVRRDRVMNAGTTPPGERIAVVESPMVAQLLMSVLKNSQNLYAETLFKRSSPSGSYDESEQLERQFITAEAGVPGDEFRTVDGCGLAPDDLVTPAALVQVLRWMNAPPRRGTWWMILAQPGSEGTLRNRLKNLSGRLRGKTGTINGVNALSGIVAGEKGGYRYFSILINHNTGPEAVPAIDAIAQEIAKF